MTMTNTSPIIANLKSIVGDTAVIIPTAAHTTDRRGIISAPAVAMVYPNSTTQVSAVVKYCHANTIGIVPQGGNTGNCAGAVPAIDCTMPCIMVNMARMNTIESIDPTNNTITVQAGCILQDIQNACQHNNRTFPITIAPADRVQAGGFLSTNAGGLNVIHYGMTRDNVLGLEYVLPNGDIVSHLNTLPKNALGIDIINLMIGAEGTLGLITRATLKLHPPITQQHTGIIALNHLNDGIDLLHNLQHNGAVVHAFEVWDSATHNFGKRHHPMPLFDTLPKSDWYGVVDIINTPQPNHTSITWITESQTKSVWNFRKNFTYALGHQGHMAHDIAVPISDWKNFINAVNTAVKNATSPPLTPAHFGHLGDGNLHVEFVRPDTLSMDDFRALTDTVGQAVYDTVKQYNGTPASEHGVGQTKRHLMHSHLSDGAYTLMQTLKNTIDPQGIMNPNKIF